MGTNNIASSGLYKITNHHVNTDEKDNGDSQPYEIPFKNCRFSSFGDTIPTTTTPRSSTLPPPGKEYICFQIEGKISHASQCDK